MNMNECSKMGYEILYKDETIVMYKRFRSGSMWLMAFSDEKDNDPAKFYLSENQTNCLKKVLNDTEE